MKLLIEHWGEHREFSLAELRGITRGEKAQMQVVEDDYPARVVEVESWEILRRAGFVRYISRHIFSEDHVPDLELHLENFAVRARKYGFTEYHSSAVERELGRKISGNVNLSAPENVVRAALARRIHAGILLYDFSAENFESRISAKLPISYPITMHPRYIRALINLAGVPTGARILDPFCGTGTILLEAALMRLNPEGSDIDARMLHAAETNLKKFSISVPLTRRDVGEIDGKYDAIITDPPYGRSSSLQGEKIRELYSRAFKKFADVTDRVSIVLPDRRGIEIGKQYFSLKEEHPVRVHKSLTRHYCLFVRE